ncbi:Glyoxalase/Bleomycin resistance protein/Dihydroxybiphenyl dioxygenase [Ilyonectria destructans]|nr:Glyoxalase/Bleomycin resistance protein/Dihydroxybiphenyl dioxygenase [Ilyonectria destructans]
MSQTDNRILLDRLSHARYGHPDLEKAKQFFIDFGLVPVLEKDDKIWFRGFGTDPFCYVAEKTHDGKRKFKGGGWIVQSMAELEKAAKLPGSTPIHDHEGPGGGKVVIMQDIMGEPITLLYGQEERVPQPREVPKRVVWNTWEDKKRLGEFQRPDRDMPSKVHKLGHYGFEVAVGQLHNVYDWYSQTFNLKKTDTLFHAQNNKTVMIFIHIDKGKEFNIFIAGSLEQKDGIKAHHTSFEVDDIDSQIVGHHHLIRKGHISVFGVGRHVLGSQIFDYWFDPSGFVVEHYVDGDLVNEDSPNNDEPAVAATVSSWGPEIPLRILG